jgi:hypothetical protein
MRNVAVAGLFFVLTSGVALPHEGQIEIGPTSTWPIVIDQPGSYLLTADLSTTSTIGAIRIEVNNVVLDLGGHVILGGGSSNGSSGVASLSGLGGITIRNGMISNFETCISVGGAVQSSNSIEDVSVSSCAEGIVATATVIRDSRASGCVISGIFDQGGAVLSSDVMYSGYGIMLAGSSCTGCTSDHNEHGFSLQNSSCDGCRAMSNSGNGYDISAGGNLLTECSAHSNALGNLVGTCTTSGNACFSCLLP